MKFSIPAGLALAVTGAPANASEIFGGSTSMASTPADLGGSPEGGVVSSSAPRRANVPGPSSNLTHWRHQQPRRHELRRAVILKFGDRIYVRPVSGSRFTRSSRNFDNP